MSLKHIAAAADSSMETVRTLNFDDTHPDHPVLVLGTCHITMWCLMETLASYEEIMDVATRAITECVPPGRRGSRGGLVSRGR